MCTASRNLSQKNVKTEISFAENNTCFRELPLKHIACLRDLNYNAGARRASIGLRGEKCVLESLSRTQSSQGRKQRFRKTLR